MPSGREGQMYAGAVKIVVHPMIQAAGKDADKVGRLGLLLWLFVGVLRNRWTETWLFVRRTQTGRGSQGCCISCQLCF
jgi:hypothetical protein